MANANTEYTLLKIVFPRYQGWKADSTKVVVDSFPLFRFFVERIWRRNCRFDSFQLQMKYMAASVKARQLFLAFFFEIRTSKSFFLSFLFFRRISRYRIFLVLWIYPSIPYRKIRNRYESVLFKKVSTSKRKRSRTSFKIWEPVTSSSFSHRTREIFLQDALPLKTIQWNNSHLPRRKPRHCPRKRRIPWRCGERNEERMYTISTRCVSPPTKHNPCVPFPVIPCGFTPYGYGTKRFPSPFHFI